MTLLFDRVESRRRRDLDIIGDSVTNKHTVALSIINNYGMARSRLDTPKPSCKVANFPLEFETLVDNLFTGHERMLSVLDGLVHKCRILPTEYLS